MQMLRETGRRLIVPFVAVANPPSRVCGCESATIDRLP